MISSLGLLLAFGAVCCAGIGWLCCRSNVWWNLAGVSLAIIVALYCGGVALILVVGSVDAGESPRLAGVLSVLALMLISCVAVLSAKRGLVNRKYLFHLCGSASKSVTR
jgi:hypothetical protein